MYYFFKLYRSLVVYDSVVVFLLVGPVRIEQNFSSFFIDTLVVGRNAFSKNANNVVISSPRVIIFSNNIEHFHSFHFIWSPDHAHFRFGRQGAPNIFFSNSIFSATLCPISEIFSGSCAPRRALLKFRGTRSSGSNLGARPPEVNFFVFFSFFEKNWSIDFRINVLNDRYWGPLWSLKFLKKSYLKFSRKWGSKILGAWHFFDFTPLGGSLPPPDPWRFWP